MKTKQEMIAHLKTCPHVVMCGDDLIDDDWYHMGLLDQVVCRECEILLASGEIEFHHVISGLFRFKQEPSPLEK